MAKTTVGHAMTAELAQFIRGRLDNERATRICNHVLVCKQCREEAQDITALLWPSLSIWIRWWLRIFSPSFPPSMLFRFVRRTIALVRPSA
jgi:hypothetical protein